MSDEDDYYSLDAMVEREYQQYRARQECVDITGTKAFNDYFKEVEEKGLRQIAKERLERMKR